MKKLLSLFLCACMIFALAACGTDDPGTQESAGAQGETAGFDFTYVGDPPTTLNLLMATSNMDLTALGYTQAGLFRLVEGKLENDLCESYTVSDDNLTYTFTLRDATWTDGESVTSEQFEYALSRMLDPAGAFSYALYFYPIANAEAYNTGEVASWDEVGVECPDEKTLVITLDYPYASFLETITDNGMFPMRQDFAEAQGESYGTSPETIPYCGPYTIESWEVTNSITYIKNPNYWNAENSFYADKITCQYIQDKGTAFAMYENGEVDCILSLDDVYKDVAPADELVTHMMGSTGVILVNQNGLTPEAGELLSNNNFRLALNYAIDREKYNIYGSELPTTRMIPSTYTTADGTPVVEAYDVFSVPVTGDVELAKDYLSKAMDELGYSSVDELPTLQMVTYESTAIRPYMELVIDMWSQNLGLNNISFTQLPIGSAIGQYYATQYDLFYFTFAYGNAEFDELGYFVTGNDGNLGIWKNEEYDSLLDEIRRTIDDEERYELLRQAEEIFNEESPIIPLSERITFSCLKPEFTGATFDSGTIGSNYFIYLQKTA